mmetsp:Transcript_4140/g.5851  ORF Transcript_4140/g.5851 Transcript_4140/m.5851 type:complete len:216 (+) Transcript_4140:344-991(+)
MAGRTKPQCRQGTSRPSPSEWKPGDMPFDLTTTTKVYCKTSQTVPTSVSFVKPTLAKQGKQGVWGELLVGCRLADQGDLLVGRHPELAWWSSDSPNLLAPSLRSRRVAVVVVAAAVAVVAVVALVGLRWVLAVCSNLRCIRLHVAISITFHTLRCISGRRLGRVLLLCWLLGGLLLVWATFRLQLLVEDLVDGFASFGWARLHVAVKHRHAIVEE